MDHVNQNWCQLFTISEAYIIPRGSQVTTRHLYFSTIVYNFFSNPCAYCAATIALCVHHSSNFSRKHRVQEFNLGFHVIPTTAQPRSYFLVDLVSTMLNQILVSSPIFMNLGTRQHLQSLSVTLHHHIWRQYLAWQPLQQRYVDINNGKNRQNDKRKLPSWSISRSSLFSSKWSLPWSACTHKLGVCDKSVK